MHKDIYKFPVPSTDTSSMKMLVVIVDNGDIQWNPSIKGQPRWWPFKRGGLS